MPTAGIPPEANCTREPIYRLTFHFLRYPKHRSSTGVRFIRAAYLDVPGGALPRDILMKPKAAFFTDQIESFRGEPITAIDGVYGLGRRQEVEELTDMYPQIISGENFEKHAADLADLEVIFATWGMPHLTGEQVDRMPKLKALFYAAGATPFRGPFVDRGVTVCSATAANAIPVAEFTLMQIMMCLKGVMANMAACTSRENIFGKNNFTGKGVYGARVTLLGRGSIVRCLLELLEKVTLDVRVIGSRELMKDRSVLDEIFAESAVVSNHLPNRDDNQHIIGKRHFEVMPHGASFINTGRGAQVDEAGLAEVFAARPDLTAMLDVQHPEPPLEGSPLYTLPNVHLTTHIAGAFGDETVRMADYVISDFKRWLKNENLQYEVTADML